MARYPTVDLKRDAKDMLERQWLRDGERLRTYAPVWKLPYFEGIRTPGPTAGQLASMVGGFAKRLPGYIALGVLIMMAGDGDFSSQRRRRPVVIRGKGRSSLAGQLAVPALRCRGVWVLTDRRIAFVAFRSRTYSRFWSGIFDAERRYTPVPVEPVVEIPAERYVSEGRVHRTRADGHKRKVRGSYYRITFIDGSGIDILAREPGSR